MNYRLLSVMLCNAALLSAATALAAPTDGQPAVTPQTPKAESAQTEPAKAAAADSAQVKATLPKREAKREDQRLDETVVTATKVGKKLGQIADAVTVIDEEEIKDSAVTDITDTLRYTPGVMFKRAGGAGQYVYTKLRGYGDGNFVMLIDGMKINDSMSTGGNFLSKFDPFLIGGIEVLKGPQSVLYGADSTAGVFSYTTKGGIEGQNVTLGAEYGSFDWKKGYGGVRGVKGNFRYSLNVVGVDTDTNISKEYFTNMSPQIKLGWGKKDFLDVEFSFLSINSKWNYARLIENGNKLTSPGQLYAFQVPDPNRYNIDNYYLTTLNVKHQINRELRQRLMLGWYKMRRQSTNLNDGLLGYVQAPNYSGGALTAVNDTAYTDANYESSNYQIDYNLIWDKNFGSVKNTALFGTNLNVAEARSWGSYGNTSGRQDTKGIYFNDQLMLLDEALVLDAGVRYDFNSAFEDKATWKAGPMYTFKKTGTTLYANYGTSFRQPTMTNLYSPTYGNTNLKPESGWTVQGGVRQHFLDGKLFVEVAAWKSELKNVIMFQYFTYSPATGQYQNRDKQITDGAELAVAWNFYPGFTARGNYNYTESYNTTAGVTTPTVQNARHSGTVGLEYKDDKMLMGVTGHYMGPRLRWNGDINQPDYVRVDLNGQYKIGKGITAYARINNLFNRRITEDPYLSPGISVIGGLRWDFDFAKGGSKAIEPINSL